MKYSRREFLKGSLAAAASVSALGLLSACSSNSSSSSDEQSSQSLDNKESVNALETPYHSLSKEAIEEKETDFVVIGAGPAGLCAALKAAEAGVHVTVIEKTAATGGCAKFGMGILAIGTDLQQQQGDVLDLDEMYNMFTEYTHYRTDCVLMRKYFEESKTTLNWIEDLGVEFEEAARYFEKSYPTWHIVRSKDGTVGGGQAKTMTDALEEKAKELGVEFLMETTACKLEIENGKISGVCAYSNDESKGYHFNCKTALLATGGFGNNAEMVQSQFGLKLGEDFFGMRFAGHEGDGVNMAWNAGVKKSDMIEEMIFDIFQPNSKGSYSSDIKLIMQQPNLLVNQQGKRFFNEEQVQNTTYMGNSLCNQTNHTGFMILDEAIKNEYVTANAVDFTSRVWNCDDFSHFDESFAKMAESGYTAIIKADSLEELAEKMGIDKENLLATVDEYNQLCNTGKDPLGKPAQYLKPITTAPYYAAQYFPSSYGTLGGIKVNSDLEVLDTNDTVIQGLYSAGTDSCTVYGDSYMFLLPGNTMGYSVNTGRFVGEAVSDFIKNN